MQLYDLYSFIIKYIYFIFIILRIQKQFVTIVYIIAYIVNYMLCQHTYRAEI